MTTDTSSYKIGTACRMAGISPNTVRTWIRRGYFKPSFETESGERLLSAADVKRLTQLKNLIERGDSIGRISKMDSERLAERLAELTDSGDSAHANAISSLSEARAALVSSRGSARLNGAANLFWNTENFTSLTELESYQRDGDPIDLVLVDLPSADTACKDAIVAFARANPSIPTVVVFDFLPRTGLNELARAGAELLRWPLNSIMLERFIYSLLPRLRSVGRTPASEPPEPEPLFTESQLSQLADARPNLACECPRHLSNLVASLGAFEAYCRQCENESPQDALLHDALRKETAKARRIMELALNRLCHEDNIPVPAA